MKESREVVLENASACDAKRYAQRENERLGASGAADRYAIPIERPDRTWTVELRTEKPGWIRRILRAAWDSL